MVRPIGSSISGAGRIPEPEIQQRPASTQDPAPEIRSQSAGNSRSTGLDQRQEVLQQERSTRQRLDQQLEGGRGVDQPSFRQLSGSPEEQEARQLMDQGRYGEAADRYREMTSGPRTTRTDRLRVLQRQAEFCQRMEQRLNHPVSHPPSEAHIREYFRTLRQAPAAEVQREFQDYSRAYYVHTGNLPLSSRTDVPTESQRNWRDLENMPRDSQTGRRTIDCEGYAYMGRQLLGEAGFEGHYGSMGIRGMTRERALQNPLEADHAVFIGRRQGADGRTDLIMVSNDQLQTQSVESRPRTVARAERDMLQSEFGRMYERPPEDAAIRTGDDLTEIHSGH